MKPGKSRSAWIGFALAALAVMVSWVIQSSYYLHIANLIGIYSLIVIGLNLLSGYTGQVSMGHAGFFAIGSYVSALLTMKLQIPFWLSIGAAALVASFSGMVIGIPAMKLSGPYLVMATVGFGEIIRLVLVNWTPVTRGAAGLTGIPLPSFLGIQVTSERDFFYLIYALVLVGTIAALRLSRSKVGRTFVAIREDELAAEAMGVPVNSYKVVAFVVSAAYAGIAGALYGSFAGVASPDNFTFEDSVGFLSMSVIGGNRTIYGALLGSFVLTVLSEALRVFQTYRLIIYGIILILTVIFVPQGLSGLARQGFVVFYRRKTRAASTKASLKEVKNR
ncbi:MAG: branched-chain amino acid ABC transporter permease [Firmicutes bacterium]|nr:branched-chain amino acid ABC transporter permease [Bacillota bacterium]